MTLRKCLRPSGMMRPKHSARHERTHLSANAFKFGLRAGNRTVSTPAVPRISTKRTA